MKIFPEIKNYFWENCSEAEYIQLWQFTVNYLSEEKEVNNLLYAYSPDKIDTVEVYLYGYPGDEYIDILGLDNYGDLRQVKRPSSNPKSERYFWLNPDFIEGNLKHKKRRTNSCESILRLRDPSLQ